MVNCPYLIYEPSHCAACTGWYCKVFGRNKKLSDTSMCVVTEEWLDCPRYTAKVGVAKEPEPTEEETDQIVDEAVDPRTYIPPPVSTDCPYLGPAPTGEPCCSNFWCLAISVPLRAYKICKQPPFHECQRYQRAVKYGVS